MDVPWFSSGASSCVDDNFISPVSLNSFPGISQENPNAVVVGLAPDEFGYENMNKAMRWVQCVVASSLSLSYCSVVVFLYYITSLSDLFDADRCRDLQRAFIVQNHQNTRCVSEAFSMYDSLISHPTNGG